MDAYAMIVAGGVGTRFGTEIPKQYTKLAGHEVIEYSLRAFSECENIRGICIVVRQEWEKHVSDLVKEKNIKKVMGICPAGEQRRDSVYNGLFFLREQAVRPEDVILVHDAARPLLTREVILENIHLASSYGACDTAVSISDTPLISDDGETVRCVPPRRTVFMSQTPQSFRFQILLTAHEQVPKDAPDITDDVALVLNTGHPVHIAKGSAQLLKITNREDLLTAERFLNDRGNDDV